VEADHDLVPGLRTQFQEAIELIEGDVLSKKETLPLKDGYVLVANLPYHIAANVLRRFLSERPRPRRMVIMVQREVADRIVAKPGDMGLLSVACQLYAECRKLENVPPSAFSPPPKVGSAIVRLEVRDPAPIEAEEALALAKAGFASRRKQLQRNLADQGCGNTETIKGWLAKLGLASDVRAQALEPRMWMKLCGIIKTYGGPGNIHRGSS
jgi:16S rRNA (adenine1518-N6/adenine1519-N6)-dimethyltransferase